MFQEFFQSRLDLLTWPLVGLVIFLVYIGITLGTQKGEWFEPARIIAAFRERFPNISLNLHQGTSEQIADMVAADKIDFAIATGSNHLFSNMLLVPSYRWDRSIIVPKGHALTRLDRKITLQDLVEYPLVTYVFSFSGESSLKRAFADEGLEPNVGFTARDADVIKTYVRMGLGVGIVASMAADCSDDSDLQVLDKLKQTLAGKGLAEQGVTEERVPRYFAVKEAVFPFVKFPGVDTLLGPEMKSTGEVMGVGADFGEAFARAQLATGQGLPTAGAVFISVNAVEKTMEYCRFLTRWPESVRIATVGARSAEALEGVGPDGQQVIPGSGARALASYHAQRGEARRADELAAQARRLAPHEGDGR